MDWTPTLVGREASRRQRRLAIRAGEELMRLRTEANLSLRAVSRATGIDPSYIAEIEAGVARPTTSTLISIGIALGAELSIRYFAGAGPRIHDRFQARMVEALLSGLHPRWRTRLEVPVGKPSRGVIDLVLEDRRSTVVIATEIQSELRRLEQQIRWSHEKSRELADSTDADVSELLVLRSTRVNRDLAVTFEATLRTAYPARVSDAVEALTSGTAEWPGPALVWMRVSGTEAHLMRHPPPGVLLGR